MSLTVLSPGPYSVIVDRGRVGSRSLGVPLGGAADRAAYAIANGLVGNPPDVPAIELTLAGPTVCAIDRTACVVFGAEFSLTISGRGEIPAGISFTLEPGETLRIGGTPTGARGYLAVAGGFDFPEILGSRSALEPLQTGEILRCRASSVPGRGLGFASLSLGDGILRVVDGPQRDWFPTADFFEWIFTVSPASNRMGIRLTGEPIARRPGELVSEAVAPGAVQVTNDGLPVVLGVDGQTIGGYPKIAHVIRADLDRLGQLRPVTQVRFQRVTQEEAETAAFERQVWLREWLTRLAVAGGK